MVGTKADRLSGNKLRTALKGLEQKLGASPILPFSSKTGNGKSDLWHAIRGSYTPE